MVAVDGRVVNLLWTGGWDSTFRVLNLASEHRCTIQPFYVIDPHRPSWRIELQTMRMMTARCHKEPKYRGSILPVITIEKDDISSCEAITASYLRLREREKLGSQYDWLPRLARERGITDLEIGIQRDGHIQKLIGKHVEPKPGWPTKTYVLRADAPDDLRIFSYFAFPILDHSKTDMQAIAREKNFRDLLELSWFCFTPKNGRPCGTCNPCRIAIEEGLSRRVGWRGAWRYFIQRRSREMLSPRLRATLKRMRRHRSHAA